MAITIQLVSAARTRCPRLREKFLIHVNADPTGISEIVNGPKVYGPGALRCHIVKQTGFGARPVTNPASCGSPGSRRLLATVNFISRRKGFPTEGVVPHRRNDDGFGHNAEFRAPNTPDTAENKSLGLNLCG